MGKKIMQTLMFVISITLNAFGIISLLHVSGIVPVSFLSFYGSMRLILRYVVIIASMAVGVMLFNLFAGTFRYKLKKGLSIGCCVYSTVLTIPLLLVFIGCFFVMDGINLPYVGSMISEIVVEFQSIFKTTALQYLIFSAGLVMSIIFLAVPIAMCKSAVKSKKIHARSF